MLKKSSSLRSKLFSGRYDENDDKTFLPTTTATTTTTATATSNNNFNHTTTINNNNGRTTSGQQQQQPNNFDAQQQLLLDQSEIQIDKKTNNLIKGLRIVKQIAQDLNDEITDSRKYFERVNSDMLDTKNILDETLRKLNVLKRKLNQVHGVYCIFVLFIFIVIFVVYYWIKMS